MSDGAMKSAPMFTGIVTSRSNGISRSSKDTILPGFGIDRLDHEVRLEVDVAVVEHRAQVLATPPAW